MLTYVEDTVSLLLKTDVLLILASGLGLYNIILSFLNRYMDRYLSIHPYSGPQRSDASSAASPFPKMILILNIPSSDISVFMEFAKLQFQHIFQLDTLTDGKTRSTTNKGPPSSHCVPLIHINTSESSESDRRQKCYSAGGVFLVSPRMLVTDILTGRLPPEMVDGLIISHAHSVCSLSWNVIFCVQLIRERNTSAFVKALSDYPDIFSRQNCKIDRILKELMLKSVYFIQRLHPSVEQTFNTSTQPTTVEVAVPLTKAMMTIQTSIIQLIEKGFVHLKRIPQFETSELSLDECCFKRGWEAQLQSILDPIWTKLSRKHKQLIQELSVFRKLLVYLTEWDAIAFMRFLDTIQFSNMVDQCWLLTSEWELIVKRAKERIYTLVRNELETPVKWTVLERDLRKLAQCLPPSGARGAAPTETSKPTYVVLIVVKESSTMHQLHQVCSVGIQHTKDTLIRSPSRYSSSRDQCRVDTSSAFSKSFSNTELDLFAEKLNTMEEREYTRSAHVDPERSEYHSETTVLCGAWVTCRDQGQEFEVFLYSCHPHIIILWSPVLSFIRALEVYSAECYHQVRNTRHKPDSQESPQDDCTLPSSTVKHEHSNHTTVCGSPRSGSAIHVYLYVFRGTAEQQSFLYTVQKERLLWNSLLKQKEFSLVRLNEAAFMEPDTVSSLTSHLRPSDSSSRKGGGGGRSVVPRALSRSLHALTPTVIVDFREFNSSLPFYLYSLCFRVIPTTLIVGDYILSRDICVERKAIPDFVSSLRSGRLLDQFKSKETFSFNSREWTVNGKGYYEPQTDVMTNFYILLQLVPGLRVLWSFSPQFTAHIFREVQDRREQPDPFRSALLGSNDVLLQSTVVVPKRVSHCVEDSQNHRVEDVIRRCPGVTSKSVPITSLSDLATMELSKMKVILGEYGVNALENRDRGHQLYRFLNFNTHHHL